MGKLPRGCEIPSAPLSRFPWLDTLGPACHLYFFLRGSWECSRAGNTWGLCDHGAKLMSPRGGSLLPQYCILLRLLSPRNSVTFLALRSWIPPSSCAAAPQSPPSTTWPEWRRRLYSGDQWVTGEWRQPGALLKTLLVPPLLSTLRRGVRQTGLGIVLICRQSLG